MIVGTINANLLRLLLALSIVIISQKAVATTGTEKFLLGEAFSLEAPAKLSWAQAKEDIDTAVRFFRRGYAGYIFLPKQDIEHAESVLLNEPHPTDPKELCRKIARAFAGLRDGHLVSANQNGDCLPVSDRTWHRKAQVGQNIAPPFGKASTKPFKLIRVKRGSLSVPVLGLTRFPFFDSPVWDGFEAAVEDAKKYGSIVIDLRGNGGGDDRRGFQLAGLLLGKPAKVKREEHIERQNPETFVLFLNKIDFLISRLQTASEQTAYLDVRKQWLQRYENAVSGKLEEYSVAAQASHFGRPISTRPFSGPVVILADAGCGSSCESTLKALRILPKATFIGEHTAGITHFGNQGLLVLPHSRIRVSMSTKFIKWADEEFIEKVGHAPDIVVKPGRDALSIALDFLAGQSAEKP